MIIAYAFVTAGVTCYPEPYSYRKSANPYPLLTLIAVHMCAVYALDFVSAITDYMIG